MRKLTLRAPRARTGVDAALDLDDPGGMRVPSFSFGVKLAIAAALVAGGAAAVIAVSGGEEEQPRALEPTGAANAPERRAIEAPRKTTAKKRPPKTSAGKTASEPSTGSSRRGSGAGGSGGQAGSGADGETGVLQPAPGGAGSDSQEEEAEEKARDAVGEGNSPVVGGATPGP